jgi:hypothetical protein
MRRPAVVLFLIALALYTPAIWWGLPHATGPDRVRPWGQDELAPLGPLAELYSVATQSPVFNPQYPLVHYILQAGLVGPFFGWLWLSGDFTSFTTEFPYGLEDPVAALAIMTLLGRMVNLLMGGGIVIAAWRFGTILWNARAGLLAAICVMLMYPMFYYTRTSNVDLGALFWVAIGLVVFAQYLRDGLTVRRALWLGVFAALATATKDPSYAAFLPLGIALPIRELLRLRREGGDRTVLWKSILAGAGVGAAIYVVLSGAILHPVRYLAHVKFAMYGTQIPGFVSPVYFATPATLAGYWSLIVKVVHNVRESLGLPMLAAAVAGVALCLRRSPRSLLFLLPCAGTVAGVILPVRFVQFRFVLVIAYILALFAGYALSLALADRRPWLSRAGFASAAIVWGWALICGGDLTYQMFHDSRYEATRWLKAHGRPGDALGYYGAPLKLPALEADMRIVAMPNQNFPTPALTRPPEFVIIIPQQIFEPVHEHSIPEHVYRSLADGSMGYVKVRHLRTRSLFESHPVTFVNPKVELYARRDRVHPSEIIE